MRRRLEFFAYIFVILFFIVRYSNADDEGDRRPMPEQPAPFPESSLPQESGGPVVVNVKESKRDSVGTAFLVNGSGTYVTARHVVDGCGQVFLMREAGKYERVRKVERQRNRDFAILRTTRFEVTPFNLTDRSPQKGEEGFFMGYPQGKPADLRAVVLGRNEMRSVGRYQMNEPVIAWVERERRPSFSGSLGGMSGGPVLVADGLVVGTAVAESPRRGRIYTTHPAVFRETGLLQGISADRAASAGVNEASFETTGSVLRRSLSIAKVYCKAR